MDDEFSDNLRTDWESRGETRYLVNWKVAIIYGEAEQRLSFRGRIFDISKGGFSLHSEYSLPPADRVTVLISIPPIVTGQRPKVIEVKSRVVYTVLSNEFNQFRTGVQFGDFKGDGRQFLDSNLARRTPAHTKSIHE
uniref:PilZ domain-containing protein n=1 Tax=Andreprevotia chitinilytica TaxID=396808 RepID=UPI00146FD58C|nr:PilZ domain-containing protein [Andreprevotia chitinilytica]